MEVIIRKFFEIVRLENEAIVFEIVFGIVHERSFQRFYFLFKKKIPHIPILITHH
jgi:hypothetical protein